MASSSGLQDYARFGITVYLTLGIGLFCTAFLSLSIVDDNSVLQSTDFFGEISDEELFFAALYLFRELLTLAPLLGAGIAVYYRISSFSGSTLKPAAIASGSGTFTIGIVALLLLIVFTPTTVDISIGEELPGLIAYALGAALTAAFGGYLLDTV